jgi:hypothetical protein
VLPGRGGSPSGWLQTEMAIGYQIHIPPHRSQQRQRRSAKLPLPGSQQDFCKPTIRARPQSHPKRVHPARQAHQPLGPETASRPQASSASVRGARPGRVDASLPAVPTPVRSPSARRATILTTAAFEATAAQLAPRVKVQPVSRLHAESKAEPSHRRSHLATITPQPWSPDRHP